MLSRTAASVPLALEGSLIAPTSADGMQGAARRAESSAAHAPRRRPGWGRLYAILPITAALSLAAHRALPEGPWRIAGDYGVAAVAAALFALWIAADRHTRTWLEPPAGSPPVRILYLYLPPSPPPAPIPDRFEAPRVRDRLPGGPAAPFPAATLHR